MTTEIDGPALDAVAAREPGRVRLVWDVELTLDEVAAELLRAELARSATVDVVLSLPRTPWSTDAALMALRGRRLAQAHSAIASPLTQEGPSR